MVCDIIEYLKTYQKKNDKSQLFEKYIRWKIRNINLNYNLNFIFNTYKNETCVLPSIFILYLQYLHVCNLNREKLVKLQNKNILSNETNQTL